MTLVALFAELLPEIPELLLSFGGHPLLTLMTFLPVCPVIIETEIPAAARQWKSFGVGTNCYSPSTTTIAILLKGVTTRMHILRNMYPFMPRDDRLVGAAPLAIIEAADKDGFVLTMRLSRPCRSIMRFL